MNPLRLVEALLCEAYSYGCAMIDLPDQQGDHIIQWGRANILPEHLYTDSEQPDDFGYENHPHITVKYGLLGQDVPPELYSIVKRTQPFPVYLGVITLFRNDKFDVVKLDIESPGLRLLNGQISQLPNEDKYPNYHPHSTVAYVKPGTCDHLEGVDLFDVDGAPSAEFIAYGMKYKGPSIEGADDDVGRAAETFLFTKKSPVQRPAVPEQVRESLENFNWHLSGDGTTAYIDWMQVPRSQRRQGVGSRAYAEWESQLPPSVRVIRLMAADAGDGPSDEFWKSLGFDYDVQGEDWESVDYEARQMMSKPRNVVEDLSDDIAKEAAKAEKPKSPEHAEAGNYKKGHVNVQGMEITIENAKGSTRSGEDKSGKKWSVILPAHYGYIAKVGGETGPRGKDKDHIDVYIGPKPEGMMVFVVNQHHKEGGFDEHKCMLGFDNKDEAVAAYDSAFSNGLGPKLRNSVVSTTMDTFKMWLKLGETKKEFKPLSESEDDEQPRPEELVQQMKGDIYYVENPTRGRDGQVAYVDKHCLWAPEKVLMTYDWARQVADYMLKRYGMEAKVMVDVGESFPFASMSFPVEPSTLSRFLHSSRKRPSRTIL